MKPSLLPVLAGFSMLLLSGCYVYDEGYHQHVVYHEEYPYDYGYHRPHYVYGGGYVRHDYHPYYREHTNVVVVAPHPYYPAHPYSRTYVAPSRTVYYGRPQTNVVVVEEKKKKHHHD